MDLGHTATALLTTIAWLVLFGACGIALSRRHNGQVDSLQLQLAEAKRAGWEATDSFRYRLGNHDAVLTRIAEISGDILGNGITDPNMTLDEVRLIDAHAREAKALIEDTAIEIGLRAGRRNPEGAVVNLRDEIETVASRFFGCGISTAGPSLLARTNAPMFRVMVRSLVAAAVDRRSPEIDIVVARNGSTVLCTVSDNAAGEHLPAVPALAAALATALGNGIETTRRMRRNLYTVSLPTEPGLPIEPHEATATAPLDVFGTRDLPISTADGPPATPHGYPEPHRHVEFPDAIVRDQNQTVAARRKSQVITR